MYTATAVFNKFSLLSDFYGFSNANCTYKVIFHSEACLLNRNIYARSSCYAVARRRHTLEISVHTFLRIVLYSFHKMKNMLTSYAKLVAILRMDFESIFLIIADMSV